jgi:transcriptional regulator with XRE-family HTH domain
MWWVVHGWQKSVEQFSERLKSIVPSGSGRDFAKKAGIGYSTVHNYLQAVSSPTLENLVLLAKAGACRLNGWLLEKSFQNRLTDHRKLLKIPFIDRVISFYWI